MPCYSPLRGWRSKQRTENGKRGITFDRASALVDFPVTLPCGKCIGCRLEYARQWSIRLMHEARDHDHNSFITLTYNDENLPQGESLVPKHMTDFLKRLRERISYYGAGKIRYYYAGEYGERTFRPHYHACIFGYFPSDARLYSETNGHRLYESEELDEIWGKGETKTGSLTTESAGYTARYITKKITGPKADEINPVTGLTHYEVMTDDGEIIARVPEFARMSRNLGQTFQTKYAQETFRDDSVIVNGTPSKPPKAYERALSDSDLEELKKARRRRANADSENNTLARLQVRETVKRAQLTKLRRG